MLRLAMPIASLLSFRGRSAPSQAASILRSVAALMLGAALLASPGLAAAATTLQVAYLPVLPMAQLFVIEAEGWAGEAGLDLRLTRFSSGPAMVQALASGKYDVAYVGIGPAMVARGNGLDLKVIAANGKDQLALLGRGAFAETFADASSPAAAFAGFRKSTGRPVKIATLPKGSVPDTVLRYYLAQVAHVSASDVEILGFGEDRVQQALLSGAVDAASILEPILTIVQERDKSARVLAKGEQMFPDQPGPVLAVRENTIRSQREAVEALLKLHIRATELIRKEPERAARDVETVIGQGLIPLATLQKALTSPAMHPISDPHAIMAGTARLARFQAEIGALPKPVTIEALFDTSLYDAVNGQRNR